MTAEGRNDTALVYLNNRYHDPTLGTFISVDPFVTITGEAYIYASADPINGSDPTGLCTVTSGEVWCTNVTGYWFNHSDPSFGPEREAARANAAGSVDVTLFGSLLPVIGELIDAFDCLGGSKVSCAALPAPIVGGRLLDEASDLAGAIARGSDEAADSTRATTRWLRGTSGNAGPVPESVRAAMEGRTYSSWRTFKSDFWRAVSDDPDLASQFTDESLAQMRKGNAPFVDETQVFGANERYILHRATPKSRGGGEFDLSNIVVVTPRYHREVLGGSYHYGGQRYK